MGLPSEFIVYGLIYLSVTVPFALWGIVVFYQWPRINPGNPTLAASCYLPWMLRVNDHLKEPSAPAPLDIARAVALTFTPIVNVAAFGPAGLLLLMEIADKSLSWLYASMDAGFDALSAHAAKTPALQRWGRWARRPMNQQSSVTN